MFLSWLKTWTLLAEGSKWENDHEILWIQLQLIGSVPLYIAAYYRPSESDTPLKNSRNLLNWCALLQAMFGFWGISVTSNSHGLTVQLSSRLAVNIPAGI